MRRAWHWLAFYSWKVYGNVRWYWPRAQMRKRVAERFRDEYAAHGMEWKPPRHWLLS